MIFNPSSPVNLTNTNIASNAAIALSKLQVGSYSKFTPTDPTATATSEKMQGLGSTATVTPTKTPVLLVMVTGLVKNDTGGDGVTWRLRYGTGTAPANGDAATGTVIGSAEQFSQVIGAGVAQPMTFVGLITGLTLSTAIWLDFSLTPAGGGNVSILGLTFQTAEVMT